jgi:hypothetical protein
MALLISKLFCKRAVWIGGSEYLKLLYVLLGEGGGRTNTYSPSKTHVYSEYRIKILNTEYRIQNTDAHVHKITNLPMYKWHSKFSGPPFQWPL